MLTNAWGCSSTCRANKAGRQPAHGNLNLKPHQLSVRFPPPTREKVNRSQVGAVVLLLAPASFRGRVSAGGKLPNRAECGEGQERKEEGLRPPDFPTWRRF